jgi:hypothetical protein
MMGLRGLDLKESGSAIGGVAGLSVLPVPVFFKSCGCWMPDTVLILEAHSVFP